MLLTEKMRYFGIKYNGLFMYCVSESYTYLFCPRALINTLMAKNLTNSDQTIYTADITTKNKSSTTNDPTTFLAYHQRELDSVVGDRNCMFRSLAKQLSGDSDNHWQLREAM